MRFLRCRRQRKKEKERKEKGKRKEKKTEERRKRKVERKKKRERKERRERRERRKRGREEREERGKKRERKEKRERGKRNKRERESEIGKKEGGRDRTICDNSSKLRKKHDKLGVKNSRIFVVSFHFLFSFFWWKKTRKFASTMLPFFLRSSRFTRLSFSKYCRYKIH